jgi:hypothetical protein
MKQAVLDLGRFLVQRIALVAPWDAVPRSVEKFPVARICTTRCLRGSVHSAITLTPYDTQSIVDDLVRTGPGTVVEVTLPSDASESVMVRTERELARLRSHGLEVVIRSSDDEGEPSSIPPTALPSVSRAVAELAVLMGRLLHDLQSERALTAAHLAARQGAPTAHLEAQWGATDGVIGVWHALLVAHADLLPPLVHMHAGAVSSLLVQLEPTRRGVQVRVRETTETVDYYTQLARALLATLDGLVAAAEAAPTMTAHLAFLHAKEEAAVEQLEVASAALLHNPAHSVAAHIASREAYLRTFTTTATEPVLSEYRALMGEPPCWATPDLEQALIEHESPHEAADADAWYRTMARVFERFHDVESRSAATLLSSAM